MATRRIKDITNTATTFASDDFIALDGSTQGTRKMDKDDLIAEISAGVSGDYLEEANNLSDVASLDTSKLNMEIPDVGTAPNEVPLNGMLGSMAFQSAEGISVARAEVETLEVTDKVDGTLNIATGSPESIADADADDLVIGDGVLTNFGATIATNSSGQAKINFADGAGANAARGQIKYDHQFDKLSVSTAGAERVVVDEYGLVGIGTSSPSSYNADADDLVVGAAGTGNRGLTIASGSTNYGVIYFADGTTGNQQYRGAISYNHNIDALSLGTVGATRWYINNSGHLVANQSGNGIDFGSGASTTLSSYETGTWTPAFGGSVTAPTGSATVRGRYVKIGDQVTCWFYILMPGSGVGSGSGELTLTGLPFQTSNSSAQDRFTGVVSYTNNFGTSTGAPTALLASYNRTYAQFTVYENSGGKVAGTVYADAADVSFGTAIIGSLSYTTI
jgi:hypothetical protein